MCLPACLKAAQMWCAAYSENVNKNVNEGLLVLPADDISLEIVPKVYYLPTSKKSLQ